MIRMEVKERLQGLTLAMREHQMASGKSAAEIVQQKGLAIILGQTNPKFGRTFKGLYQRLRDRAPKEGEITVDAMERFAAAGRGRQPLKVRDRAFSRADNLLEGRASGVFTTVKFGVGEKRVRVLPVRFAKRTGKRILRPRKGSGVVRAGQRSDLGPNDVILNRRSLANIIELGIREAGRGYTSLSFLAGRFMRVFKRGQPVPKELKITNRTGSALGTASFTFNERDGATFVIQGHVPGQEKGEVQRIVADVIEDVRLDTMAYVERKERERLERSLLKGIRR